MLDEPRYPMPHKPGRPRPQSRRVEPRELFEVSMLDGAAGVLHRRHFGDVENQYPWSTLDPAEYPISLVERMRIGWTHNAFNEYCTAIAMGQIVQALGQVRAPLDLWSLACQFPIQEVLHVELCARVATQLGGGAPLDYAPSTLAVPLDPSLTAIQRASELIVRVCCIGEAVSLPLLAGHMKAATHPVTKGVLTKIVQDEALHGKLGLLYLDWIAAELDVVERDRLARVARDTLDSYQEIWDSLSSRVVDGMTSEGYRVEHIHALGWMDSEAYKECAADNLRRVAIEPLRRYGIDC